MRFSRLVSRLSLGNLVLVACIKIVKVLQIATVAGLGGKKKLNDDTKMIELCENIFAYVEAFVSEYVSLETLF